ncbi:MAG: hypothetical protein AAGA58_10180 [Verrucomicrobiota bacterium]
MNLYIATRWGNPQEPDGPDDADTNFLVRAETREEAASLADELLKKMPTSEGTNRPVQNFTHCVTHIGTTDLGENPHVIHGPWIKHLILCEDGDYDYWHRDTPDGDWTNISEQQRIEEAEQSR